MSSFRDRWTYAEGDPSILLFDRAVKAGWIDLPQGARVLELGCCETNFHEWLLRADPSIRLTGVDVNDCPGYSGTFVKGPAERADFDWASFEAVICLGSLEHFGLGFYGDPVESDAQCLVAERVGRWLVPGGVWYYDVPWTPQVSYVTDNRHFRVYDDRELRKLDAISHTVPKHRAYAHGETNAPQAIRPTSPTTPFWYVQRLTEAAH